MRVLADGCWGFAATAILTPAELKKTANQAMQVAKASAVTRHDPVVLAEQEPFVDFYQSPCVRDPFAVSTDEKIGLLVKVTDVLKKAKKIKSAEAEMISSRRIAISVWKARISGGVIESGAAIMQSL
jgi:TldD protein